MGGKRIIEKLGGKGNIVFFKLGDQPNIDERLKGLRKFLQLGPTFTSRPRWT